MSHHRGPHTYHAPPPPSTDPQDVHSADCTTDDDLGSEASDMFLPPSRKQHLHTNVVHDDDDDDLDVTGITTRTTTTTTAKPARGVRFMPSTELSTPSASSGATNYKDALLSASSTPVPASSSSSSILHEQQQHESRALTSPSKKLRLRRDPPPSVIAQAQELREGDEDVEQKQQQTTPPPSSSAFTHFAVDESQEPKDGSLLQLDLQQSSSYDGSKRSSNEGSRRSSLAAHPDGPPQRSTTMGPNSPRLDLDDEDEQHDGDENDDDKGDQQQQQQEREREPEPVSPLLKLHRDSSSLSAASKSATPLSPTNDRRDNSGGFASRLKTSPMLPPAAIAGSPVHVVRQQQQQQQQQQIGAAKKKVSISIASSANNSVNKHPVVTTPLSLQTGNSVTVQGASASSSLDSKRPPAIITVDSEIDAPTVRSGAQTPDQVENAEVRSQQSAQSGQSGGQASSSSSGALSKGKVSSGANSTTTTTLQRSPHQKYGPPATTSSQLRTVSSADAEVIGGLTVRLDRALGQANESAEKIVSLTTQPFDDVTKVQATNLFATVHRVPELQREQLLCMSSASSASEQEQQQRLLNPHQRHQQHQGDGGNGNASGGAPPGSGSGRTLEAFLSSAAASGFQQQQNHPSGESPHSSSQAGGRTNPFGHTDDSFGSAPTTPGGTSGQSRALTLDLHDPSGRLSRSSSVSSLASHAGHNFGINLGEHGKYVPPLALCSFQLSVHDEPICVPVDIDVALLFVDVSGYSKISAALEARGAFALFETVNTYICQLLAVISWHGGEVIHFAGDALSCVWYYPDLKDSVRAAAHCAVALQRECGSFDVIGTDKKLSIHEGIVCGPVRSEVFKSLNVRHMQQSFHVISGEPMRKVGDIVSTAASGQICVTDDVAELCCDSFRFVAPTKVLPEGERTYPGMEILMLDLANLNVVVVDGSGGNEKDGDSSNNNNTSNDNSQNNSAGVGASASASASASFSVNSSGGHNLLRAGSSCASAGELATAAAAATASSGGGSGGGSGDAPTSQQQPALEQEQEDQQQLEFACNCVVGPSMLRRYRNSVSESVELDINQFPAHVKSFVPPKLLNMNKRGQRSQLDTAEMRLLTVAFIHKTDGSVDLGDWVEEVQRTIDEHSASIVQILDDDKGVHIVAAINLQTADREPAVTGIRLARALNDRHAGCTIGLATGVTFCGVVGNETCCRFDITGWACVRAARLMQFGCANAINVVIGESVVDFAGDASLVSFIKQTEIKGTPDPVSVFGLSVVDTSVLGAISTPGLSCSLVHEKHYRDIMRRMEREDQQRLSVLCHGSTNSGKFILCARVAYENRFVGISHTSIQGSRPLDLLYTLAGWFAHHDIAELRTLAGEVQETLLKRHHIRSTVLALQLVDCTIKHGLKTAVIVRQAQRLDAMSLSFLRQSVNVHKPSEGAGRWLVFTSIVPQFGAAQWSQIAAAIHKETLVIHVAHLSERSATEFIRDRIQWKCNEQLRRTILHVAGFSVGAIDAVVKKTREFSNEAYVLRTNGVYTATRSALEKLLQTPWTEISRSICSKVSTLVGDLPAAAVTMLKVIAVLSSRYITLSKAFVAQVAPILLRYSNRKMQQQIDHLMDLDLIVKARPFTTAFNPKYFDRRGVGSKRRSNNKGSGPPMGTLLTTLQRSNSIAHTLPGGDATAGNDQQQHPVSSALKHSSPQNQQKEAARGAGAEDDDGDDEETSSNATSGARQQRSSSPFSSASPHHHHQHHHHQHHRSQPHSLKGRGGAAAIYGGGAADDATTATNDDESAAGTTDDPLTDEFIEFESTALMNMMLGTTLPSEFTAISKQAARCFCNFYETNCPETCYALSHFAYLADDVETYRSSKTQADELLAYVESELLQRNAQNDADTLTMGGVAQDAAVMAEMTQALIQIKLQLSVDTTRLRMRRGEISNFEDAGKQFFDNGDSPTTSPTTRRVHQRGLSGLVASPSPATPSPGSTKNNNKGTNLFASPLIATPSSPTTMFEIAVDPDSKKLPREVVDMRYWKPSLTFGVLGFPLRKVCTFLTDLAVHASSKISTAYADVEERQTNVAFYCKLKDQIDRVVGFQPTHPDHQDEKAFLLDLVKPKDYDTVLENAAKFREYMRTTLVEREKRIHFHVIGELYVPYAPSYKPIFELDSVDRKALKNALTKAVDLWRTSRVEALRNGLMQMACAGWVPKNPAVCIEYHRDVFLRERTADLNCYVSFCFVNLTISHV